MIEYNGNKYNYKFTLPRVEKIEKAIGKPILSLLIENKGVISLENLKVLHENGLRTEDDNFVGEKIAKEMFEEVLNQKGYAALLEELAEALQRDCPFFFPAD